VIELVESKTIDFCFVFWSNRLEGHIAMEANVNSKGQIIIPSAIRKQLGIKDGTYIHVDMDIEKRQIILTPVTRQYVHSLRGKYKGRGLMKALMTEKKSDRYC
jgi:AbrB family looped-hinge helix DNA binding protein